MLFFHSIYKKLQQNIVLHIETRAEHKHFKDPATEMKGLICFYMHKTDKEIVSSRHYFITRARGDLPWDLTKGLISLMYMILHRDSPIWRRGIVIAWYVTVPGWIHGRAVRCQLSIQSDLGNY